MNIDAPGARPRTSIVENVRIMPAWLKLMTGHALFCFSLFVLALIPRDGNWLGDRKLPYAEWWASGVGPLIAATGLVMTMAGVLFLLRRGVGRYLYLGVFAGALVGVSIYEGNLIAAGLGAGFVVGLSAYLFRSDAVRDYFGTQLPAE